MFIIPNPALFDKVVNMLDGIPMEGRDVLVQCELDSLKAQFNEALRMVEVNFYSLAQKAFQGD